MLPAEGAEESVDRFVAIEVSAQQGSIILIVDIHVIRRFLLGGFLARKIHLPTRSAILRLLGYSLFSCPIRPRSRGSSLNA